MFITGTVKINNMKKLENYINRNESMISRKKNLEPLYTFKNFPVFMGCTNKPIENDLLADMNWEIDPDSGLIQLSKLIPLDILYMDQHMDATGKTWNDYNLALAKFIIENKVQNILEIGGGSGKLAKIILDLDNKLEYTIVEPNPTFEESKRLKLTKTFFNKTLNFSPDIKTIVLSQVFEHVYDPEKFLEEIYSVLPIGGKFIFGYPNLEFLFQNKFTNAINFEHTMLMTDYFVDYFLKKCGFEIELKINYQNHSHFYCVSKKEYLIEDYVQLKSKYEHYKNMFNSFIKYHEKLVIELNQEIKNKQSKIFLFGAHIFSQYLFSFGLDPNSIECILDNSPLKQGKRLYGTDLKVFSPQILKDEHAPIVILKAGLYNDEIKQDILNNINSKTIFI